MYNEIDHRSVVEVFLRIIVNYEIDFLTKDIVVKRVDHEEILSQIFFRNSCRTLRINLRYGDRVQSREVHFFI